MYCLRAENSHRVKKAQYNKENNEFLKVRIKNRTSYCFDVIIKLEDFALDDKYFNRQKT